MEQNIALKYPAVCSVLFNQQPHCFTDFPCEYNALEAFQFKILTYINWILMSFQVSKEQQSLHILLTVTMHSENTYVGQEHNCFC